MVGILKTFKFINVKGPMYMKWNHEAEQLTVLGDLQKVWWVLECLHALSLALCWVWKLLEQTG